MTREMPFLRRARVTNYKSIASCEVVFAPLLILLGPNGAGKSNFVDALLFVADALASTPADAVARRDGLDEALRRVPEAVDEFSVELELMVELDGESKPAKYAFTLGRDVTESRSLVVRREHCVLQLAAADEEDEAWLAEFEVENGQIAGGGRIERDRLYLPLVATTQGEFTEIYYGLRSMVFHHLDTDHMRKIAPDRSGTQLGYAGERLGSVLGHLERNHPTFKARVDDYLKAIVPEAVGVSQRMIGTYSTVELHTRSGERSFGPEAISEGTLHATGVLAALSSPLSWTGRPLWWQSRNRRPHFTRLPHGASGVDVRGDHRDR
ncbi:AAA family ATPase [Microbispora sp. NBC_01189]|uniref:AAA family ATPase n=1 Tax=Microbispora sp. NBC_01189 TaxID=2903583 RepID=UPI002E0D2644|nr:AAA family ATPase [Microbispora sp. NBC_01189]